MYQIISRRYRPSLFCDVVGQAAAVKTIKNAISSDTTASVYLFCGSRGTGKTTLARLLAKAVNCNNRIIDCEPCNKCISCKSFLNGQSMDFIEIDGASNRGIEDIRNLKESLFFVPVINKFKIYLLDEVHMLTKEAFNALLKILEEPPQHVKFIFATTEPHKVPPTVLSRCQRFNIKKISVENIIEKLNKITIESGVKCEKEALTTIANMSEGSLRDAESFLEHLLYNEQKNITEAMVCEAFGIPNKDLIQKVQTAIQTQQLNVAFEIAEYIFSFGLCTNRFIESLIMNFRTQLLDMSLNKIKDSILSTEQLLYILETLQDSSLKIKNSPFEKQFIELLLLKIIKSASYKSNYTLLNELKLLEDRLTSEITESIDSSEKTIVKQNDTETKKSVKKESIKESISENSEIVEQKEIKQKKEKTTPKQQNNSENKVNITPTEITDMKPKEVSEDPDSIKTKQAFYDTLMQFAAVEFQGSLEK